MSSAPLQQAEEGSGRAKKGHSEEQILRALRRAKNYIKVSEIGREYGISEADEYHAKMSVYRRRPPQEALRMRLRELAASRAGFGDRMPTVILRREGWRVDPKRIYRLYTEDRLTVRTKIRKQLAQRSRGTDSHGDAPQSDMGYGLYERGTS